MLPAPRDIFATSMLEATRVVLEASLNAFKSLQGHVVVRVDPGGDTYRVFVLDDDTESFNVKAAYGPYQSRR